jgi:hypothetical protein
MGARLIHLMEDPMSKLADGAGTQIDDARHGIADFGENLKTNINGLGRGLDEATIPDAFSKAPKFISPRVHSWLDLAVTGYFAALGIGCAARGKVRPAIAAFVNAGMVAGVSMFTDYEGTGEKPISFKMHGTLDALQATTAAIAPMLHGFASEPEAKFFYGQAANEVAVIASTDWDNGMPAHKRHKRT